MQTDPARSTRVRHLKIRPMIPADKARTLAIYQAGLDGGNASFETAVPACEAFYGGKLPEHRYVATLDDRVVGWIACSRISARPVYAGVVEHSVYVEPRVQGQGVGRALLDALIESTEAAGVWTIQSGIFPENVASLALHAAVGFRTLGIRERIGRHPGVGGDKWRDVVFVERRSAVVG